MIKNGIGWGRPSSASGSLEVVSPRRFGAHEELAGLAGVTSLAEDVSEPTMAVDSDLGDLFYDLLKQVWHAEKKFHASLPKLAKAADLDALRAAFKRHEIETERQMSRLGTVFTLIDKPAKDDATVVVGALVDECLEALSKYKDSNSLDAALIARAQMIEHFEIACYGTLISWAAQLGYDQAVALLEESLEEEENLDETLTEMAEGKSNLEADKEETKPRKTRAASRQ